jgi:carbonic anhydrase/acetyltransferase-like protein (isoleucine patch superfamily)
MGQFCMVDIFGFDQTICANNGVFTNFGIVQNHAVHANQNIFSNAATMQNIPANVLAMGSPAKVARDLSEQEKKWKTRGTQEYMELAHR